MKKPRPETIDYRSQQSFDPKKERRNILFTKGAVAYQKRRKTVSSSLPLRIPRDKEDSIRVKKNKKKYPRGILVLARRASEAASTPPPSLTILRDRAIVCGQMAQKKEGCGEKKGGKEVKVKEGEGARKLVLRKGKGREGRLARERPKSVGRALRCRAGGDESRLAFRERETQ